MYARVVGRLIRHGYARAVAGDTRILLAMAADDIEFRFPGASSFAAATTGTEPLARWMRRFASMEPTFSVDDVLVSGPPWQMRVAVCFHDAIGTDYRNEGVEVLRVRWGKLRSLSVHLDTERITAWEAMHPERALA